MYWLYPIKLPDMIKTLLIGINCSKKRIFYEMMIMIYFMYIKILQIMLKPEYSTIFRDPEHE